MKRQRFEEILDGIVREDSRYPREAYVFLRMALDFTLRRLNKPEKGPGRHVSGQELTEGIRQYALQEFGPIAATVLRTWGIARTEDFGEIVFNLVNHGLLGKTEQDRKEDFANGYDFREAFVVPFLPAAGRNPTRDGEKGPPGQSRKRQPR